MSSDKRFGLYVGDKWNGSSFTSHVEAKAASDMLSARTGKKYEVRERSTASAVPTASVSVQDLAEFEKYAKRVERELEDAAAALQDAKARIESAEARAKAAEARVAELEKAAAEKPADTTPEKPAADAKPKK